MSQQRRMHGPGGGMGAIEKSKRGIRGIFRELFTYSSKLKVPMAIALLLAAVGAVLTIVGPNQLADITNLISDGLMTGIDLAAVGKIGVRLLIIYGVSGLCSYIMHFIMATITLDLSKTMRDDLSAVCAQAPQDTKILVNSRQTGNNIIASADYTIHRPMAEKLGIPLWEFCGNWSMHTKSVLIDDDLSLIGSFNFDPRIANQDTELMLAVYSKELASQLEDNMNSLWSESLAYANGTYQPGTVTVKDASFWKMAAIVVLSPFVSLVRFLT